jgi:hypothetical protein
MKKSWRTTAAGVTAAIGFLFTQVSNLLDSDPATVCDFGEVMAALSVLYLGWSSRDDKVSSEEAGVK